MCAGHNGIHILFPESDCMITAGNSFVNQEATAQKKLLTNQPNKANINTDFIGDRHSGFHSFS